MYTLKDLLEDIECFDLNAEITTNGCDNRCGEMFCIINPEPIDGHRTWFITGGIEVREDV